MGFLTIPNQPILFDSDIQVGKNNDTSAYAQLLQSGDRMCVQLQATPITDDLISPSTVILEYVTDKNFANTGVDWTLGTGWTDLGTGRVRYNGFPATTLEQTLATPMTVGFPYRCTIICDALVSGVIAVYCGTSLVGKITEAGTYIFDFTHIGNALIFLQQDPDDDVLADFTVSEFSIVDLLWSTLNYDFSSNNEVQTINTNPDFTGNADGWDLTGNVAYSSNTIVKTAGVTGFAKQVPSGVVNRLMHTVTINVTAMSAGQIDVSFGNAALGTITTNGVYTYEYNLPTEITGLYEQGQFVLAFDLNCACTVTTAKIERNVPQWEYNDGVLCRNTLSGVTALTVFLNSGTGYTNYRFTISNRTQGHIHLLTTDGLTDIYSQNGEYNVFVLTSTIADFQIIANDNFDGCLTIFEVYEYSNNIEYVIVNTLGTEVTDHYAATLYNDFVTFCFDLGDVTPIDLDAGCFQVKVIDNATSTSTTSTTLISYSATTPIRLSAWVSGQNTGIQDGFYWGDIFVMGQRIRLLRISPTWEVQGKDYVYSSGRNVSPAITKDKLYELFIDYLDEWAHDALVIQLFADEFTIDDVPYFTNLENYEPEWSKNMNRNLAQVRMTIKKKVSRLFKTLS